MTTSDSKNKLANNSIKSIILFFVSTILFSWIVWLPLIILNLDTTQNSPVGLALFMLGGFGPSIVGLFFLKRSRTPDLKDRLLSVKSMGLKWFVLSLTIYPLLFGCALLVHNLYDGEMPAGELLTDMLSNPIVFLISSIVIFLLGPLAEEIGWRGFALNTLQQITSPIKSTLILSVVWWAWHLPLFLMPTTTHGESGINSLFGYGYFFTIVGYSVLFTWLCNKSKNQSILIAILAHFSINFVIGVLLPFDDTIFATVMFLVLALAGGLILADRQLGYHED